MASRRKRKVAASAWMIAVGWTLATVAMCIGLISGALRVEASLLLYTLGLSLALGGQAWLERDRVRDAIDFRRRNAIRRQHRSIFGRDDHRRAMKRVAPLSDRFVPSDQHERFQESFSTDRSAEGVRVEPHSTLVFQLRQAMQNAEAAAWEWEIPTGVMLGSEQWSILLGYEPFAIEPRIEAWTDLIHADDRPALRRAIENHLGGQSPSISVDLRAMNRRGDWQWLELRCRVIERDTEQAPKRLSGLILKTQQPRSRENSSPQASAGIDFVSVSELRNDPRPVFHGHEEARLAEPSLTTEVESDALASIDFQSDIFRYVPMQETVVTQAAPLHAEPEEGSERVVIRLEGAHVLVAEDGIENQRILRWQLERLGCRVSMVEDGQAALARLVSSPQDFDLLCLDMQMPVMDGYSTARRLRDLGFDLPIIALTAYLAEGEQRRCREAGCDAWLEKPVHRERLRECLVDQLQRRGSRAAPVS